MWSSLVKNPFPAPSFTQLPIVVGVELMPHGLFDACLADSFKKKTLIFSVFLLSFLERQVDHHPTVFKPGFHDVLQADLTLNLSSS